MTGWVSTPALSRATLVAAAGLIGAALTGCVFPGSPSRTTTQDEFGSLMDDLEARVFARLPDETWFYPGHGDDGPDRGRWRPHLKEWRERGW